MILELIIYKIQKSPNCEERAILQGQGGSPFTSVLNKKKASRLNREAFVLEAGLEPYFKEIQLIHKKP